MNGDCHAIPAGVLLQQDETHAGTQRKPNAPNRMMRVTATVSG